MKPSIINLTPHAIYEVESGINFPVSGSIARVSSSSELMYYIEQEGGLLPVYKTSFGEVQGLPETPTNGTFYIVSGIVLSAMPNRWDLLAPGELVRDKNGNPTGCRGFRTN